MKSLGFLTLLLLTACGQTARTVVYSDSTFDKLSSRRNVRVTFIDGTVVQFYKIEVVKVDETHIYARCWEKEGSDAADYKFLKSDVVIESVEFSTSRTLSYVAGIALSIGILFLLQRIIYGG
jgi:hypothetical protein